MVKSRKDLDDSFGRKLRRLRNIRGISQSTLAAEVDITFQQIQKYEKGINRISANRLQDFARILGVHTSYFYDNDDKQTDITSNFLQESSSKFVSEDILDSKESAVFLREFYKIKDQAKRKHIIEIMKAMSEEKK